MRPGLQRSLVLLGVALAVGLGGVLAWAEGPLAAPLTALRRALQPAGAAVAEQSDPTTRELVGRLAAENAALRDRLQQWAEIPGEGAAVPERTVIARGRIIGRSDRAGRRYVELDVGRADGVIRGMAATAGWSLVGEVVAAEDGRCLVQLCSDSRFRCAGTVTRLIAPSGSTTAGSTTARLGEGVVAGDGRSAALGLELVGSGPDLPLAAGQVVTTAGADGRFIAGLVLGTIANPRREPGDRWLADIVPGRTAETVESMMVIRGY